MNVCFFGSYNPTYSRNKILIDGLEKNGATVFHCRSNSGSIVKRYPELIRQFLPLQKKVDVIYVAFVGHLDMPLAWLLGKLFDKKVIFDMFYSMYDTYVYDRKSTTPKSLKAYSYILIDKLAGALADIIITDTEAQGVYFQKLFKLNPHKFHRIFVGGDDTIFKPLKKKSSQKIIIEFHGMFTRLQGAEFYVEAAKRLEKEKNLQFLLIGSTTNYSLPIELYKKLKPKNMTYIPALGVEKLAKLIAQSDISIGHIGTTTKARNVIANKIFHALHCGVAVIAGDCPATHELLKDRKTTLFTQMGDVDDLIRNITFLASDLQLRNTIAKNGYSLSQAQLTNKKLGHQFLTICEKSMKD